MESGKLKLLSLLEQNARLSDAQLAMMTGLDEETVRQQLQEYIEKGILCGYAAKVDWSKAGREYIQAFIRLKVTPQADKGFEDVARRIMVMPEVESVYLVSGGYDLSITMSAPTLRDVADFVSRRLSTLGSVVSTDTTFVLQRYKEGGVNFLPDAPSDERREIVL